MTFGLESLVIFLIVILPGFTAQSYTRRYIPRPKPPTTLEEIAAVIQNAMLIHIIGVLIFVLAIAAWNAWIHDLSTSTLFADGPVGYFKVHPLTAIIIGLLYSTYLLIAGPVVGALNTAFRLSAWFLQVLRLIASKCKRPGIVPEEVLH